MQLLHAKRGVMELGYAVVNKTHMVLVFLRRRWTATESTIIKGIKCVAELHVRDGEQEQGEGARFWTVTFKLRPEEECKRAST